MISAIVPIKKESQRVENKNFKTINKKPLFFWIISSLNASNYIDEIVINCDDSYTEEKLSQYFNSLKFVYRSEDLKGNEISMNKIISFTLDECKNESIFQTHTTNPLLTVETIDTVIKKHIDNSLDYFAVSKLQERLYDQSGNPINHNINELIQTQDLEPLYQENSGFYIFSKKSFRENNNRITSTSTFFETSFPENIDIDNQSDFEIAEKALMRMK
ncbi:MAG: acylneuraminate cytidylyltransferase [Flavobacteriaceae bacterium]|nr:acylneuraminate cytidylyltransferase [Flavobacteriaceae bacterium]|tara:strand:- start:300 stop:950 length:651 start_codon:yes stop_codon:yes gene_type:complete